MPIKDPTKGIVRSDAGNQPVKTLEEYKQQANREIAEKETGFENMNFWQKLAYGFRHASDIPLSTLGEDIHQISRESKTLQNTAVRKAVEEKSKTDPTYKQNAVKNVQRFAPDLSQFYSEMANGTNPYLHPSDIDWEFIAPLVQMKVDAGLTNDAVQTFNDYLRGIMANNQGTGEKIWYWTKRFAGTGVTCVLDLVSLGYSLVNLVPAAMRSIWEGDATYILDDITMRNGISEFSAHLTDKWRENNPIYTHSDELFLDPESAGFMATMAIPAGEINAFAKLGQADKAATTMSKIFKGSAKAEKFGHKIDDIAQGIYRSSRADRKATEVYEDFVKSGSLPMEFQTIKQEKYYEALKSGKRIKEAEADARNAVIKQIRSNRIAGNISRRQLFTSAALEAKQEEYETIKSIQNNYEQTYERRREELKQKIYNGEIDIKSLENIEVSDELFKSKLEELEAQGIRQEIADYMITRYNEEKANGAILPPLTDQGLHEIVDEAIVSQARIEATVDAYTMSKHEDMLEKMQKEITQAATADFLVNMVILFGTERFGGYNTYVPGYNAVRRTVRDGSKKVIDPVLRNVQNRAGEVAYSRIKGVANTAKNASKVLIVENAQELGQGAIGAGADYTSKYNAEAFVKNHMSGVGNEFAEEEINPFLGTIQNFGRGFTKEEAIKTVRATTRQMLVGTPSVIKYTRYGGRPQGAFYRGVNESKGAYAWRLFEQNIPLNSPVGREITNSIRENESSRAFVDAYNSLQSKSQAFSGFASSSVNYRVAAFNAAGQDNEAEYDMNARAAMISEAIFLSQLRNRGHKSPFTLYENLRDINTKREGETDEEFEKRKANTLNQLRRDSNYNSVKEASDEKLIEMASELGKNMLETVDRVREKAESLSNRYNGNIDWISMYGLLYNEEMRNYVKEKMAADNLQLEELAEKIEVTDFDKEGLSREFTDNKGKSQRIYDERELLLMHLNKNHATREAAMNSSLAGQKRIVDSLISQLAQINPNIDYRKIFTDLSNKEALLSSAKAEFSTIVHNPNRWSSYIRDKVIRENSKKTANDIIDIIRDSNKSEAEKRAEIVKKMFEHFDEANSGNIIKAHLRYQLSAEEYAKYLRNIGQVRAINLTLQKLFSNLIMKNNVSKDDVDVLNAYGSLINKINNSGYEFTDPEIANVLTIEERSLLQNLLDIYEEYKNSNPTGKLTEEKNPAAVAEEEEKKKKEKSPKEIKAQTDEQLLKSDRLRFERIWNKFKETLPATISFENVTMTREQLLDYKFGDENSESMNEIIAKLNEGFKKGEYKTAADFRAAIVKLQIKYNNGYRNKLLSYVLNNLNNTDEEELTQLQDNKSDETEKRDSAVPKRVFLAKPEDFTEWDEAKDSPYARFMKKYKIAKLWRSKLLKPGTSIYAVWDKSFANECLSSYKGNTNALPTESQIGLVAVVEGKIAGYEDNVIIIDGKAYTRVGLFRAVGKGQHNSKQTVETLLSRLTGSEFDATRVVDKEFLEGMPEASIIDADIKIKRMVENKLRSGSSKRDVSDLAYEYEENKEIKAGDINETHDDTENKNKGVAARAKEWFLNHLKTVKGNNRKVLQLVAEGHDGVPILIKPISETKFNEKPVLNILESDNAEDLSILFGMHPFKSAFDILSNLMSKNSKAVSAFVNSKKKDKDLKELQKAFDDSLNSTNNNKGFNNLSYLFSLPKNYKYQVNYKNGNLVLEVVNVTNEKPLFQFLKYELPESNISGLSEVKSISEVAKALSILIKDPNTGAIRTSRSIGESENISERRDRLSGKPIEFVKWNVSYVSATSANEIAEEHMSDLYDLGVFEAYSQSWIVDDVNLEIMSEDESLMPKEEVGTTQEKNTEGENIFDRIKNLFKNTFANAMNKENIEKLQYAENIKNWMLDEFDTIAFNEKIEGTFVKPFFIGLRKDTIVFVFEHTSDITEENKMAIIDFMSDKFEGLQASIVSIESIFGNEEGSETETETNPAPSSSDINRDEEVARLKEMIRESQVDLQETIIDTVISITEDYESTREELLEKAINALIDRNKTADAAYSKLEEAEMDPDKIESELRCCF